MASPPFNGPPQPAPPEACEPVPEPTGEDLVVYNEPLEPQGS